MTKIIAKPVPRKIWIDSFRITSSGIEAYTLINDESVDFHINESDFEKWCDDNEMRDYEVNISATETGLERDIMCTMSWEEVYRGYEEMEKFLKAYISFLYDQADLDIETPLKQILSTHKAAAI